MKIKIREIMIFCFVLLITSCSSGVNQSDIIAPGAVTELTFAEKESSVCLTWINPKDIDFDHVEIVATPTDTSLHTVTVETEKRITTTCTIIGLISSTEYTFSIKAIDTSGNKSESCDKKTSTIAVGETVSGVTPPSWLVGTTWTCIIIDDSIFELTFEFKTNDVIMTSYEIPMSISETVSEEDSIISYYNSKEFKIIVDGECYMAFNNISENGILSVLFTEDSDIPLLLAFETKIITNQGINPPSWLIDTYWSGSFTAEDNAEIDVKYNFTENNLKSTVGGNPVNYKAYQVENPSLGITSISSPVYYKIDLSENIDGENIFVKNSRMLFFSKTLQDDMIKCALCEENGDIIYDFDLAANVRL